MPVRVPGGEAQGPFPPSPEQLGALLGRWSFPLLPPEGQGLWVVPVQLCLFSLDEGDIVPATKGSRAPLNCSK